MNRKEFSEMLIAKREAAGIGKNEMCRRTRYTFAHLQPLETASHNYNLERVFVFLQAIDSGVVLTNGKQRVSLKSEPEFLQWLTHARGTLSKQELANKAGISRNTLINIESAKTTARIDSALALIDALGFQIETV